MDAKAKRLYQKPTIERISMVGEMATQTSCKGSSVVTVKNYTTACTNSGCKSPGGS